MCGIAGQLRPDGPVERELVERMCAAIEHRGPDARGIFLDRNVGLGIQRLRVIDLATGDQPIYNEDGTVAVVLNGEIYNFGELRAELRRRGHRLSTEGDTEVIAHLYEELGPRCVERLHGMFAFALWDSVRRRLVLARDRVGKKPLYYALRGGGITFASEMLALLEDPDVPRDIDPEAIDAYLALGYVPAPRSAFRSVAKLPPAHTLVLEDGAARVSRYWHLDHLTQGEQACDEAEACERIREALRRATRRRLVSDVPLGAFLSGGVDSSAVVAAMAQETSGPVKTFSIGFDRESFDERRHARRIAELFGTDHHEFVVRADATEVLPQILRHHGEPFSDASAIPSFYLASLTRKHVTVALNGDGGDEAFGGYTRYVANRLAGRLRGLPGGVRRTIGAVGARIPASDAVSSPANRARRLAQAVALDPALGYARYVSVFDPAQRAALYTPELRAQIHSHPGEEAVLGAWAAAAGADPIDVMLAVDTQTYLPGDLIPKIDIATMAHSLEARSPLLDHEVLELAASIPGPLKVHGGQKKWIFRQALRPWLPAEILDRPKAGFSAPVNDWLRHELRDQVRDVLLDSETRERGWFREDEVRRLLERHARGAEADARRIWSLYVFELWHREVVGRRPLVSQVPRPSMR